MKTVLRIIKVLLLTVLIFFMIFFLILAMTGGISMGQSTYFRAGKFSGIRFKETGLENIFCLGFKSYDNLENPYCIGVGLVERYAGFDI